MNKEEKSACWIENPADEYRYVAQNGDLTRIIHALACHGIQPKQNQILPEVLTRPHGQVEIEQLFLRAVQAYFNREPENP